jgi:hypothetical protein
MAYPGYANCLRAYLHVDEDALQVKVAGKAWMADPMVWARRPLPAPLLAYAAFDVAHLLPLRCAAPPCTRPPARTCLHAYTHTHTYIHTHTNDSSTHTRPRRRRPDGHVRAGAQGGDVAPVGV